ncbi:MAG: glycosyltransferase family A protein [Solirubrobacteraceae bacterium]
MSSTVGVAIPAYNSELWLAQAIDSLLAQSSPPGDILVLDDGSTDATAAVAERFGAPVRVVSQENAGIGAARNRAVELVRGEIVAFLDADDLYTPSSIAIRLGVLAEHPHVDVVFGHERRFAEVLDGRPVPSGSPHPSPLPGSMLVRRSALQRVGPFPSGVRVAEGLDWLLRARELSVQDLTVEDQVVWRRVHGENNSLRHRDSMGEFARTLKASLDRRRAAAANGSAPASVSTTPVCPEADR